MPRYDGTGPAGRGSMTGGGRGFCATPAEGAVQRPFGRRAAGRGRRCRSAAGLSTGETVAMLKEEAEMLKEELKKIQGRDNRTTGGCAMRLGITLQDQSGLQGNVAQHFGQCKYFFLLDIEDNKVKNSRIVANTAVHGGGGCVAVDELLKYDITHVIAGGMGMGAQQKFAQAGVEVFGYSGRVKEAIDDFLSKKLCGLDACKDHGECH
jgi:predicted Fe-Mo cluster-binding NifX family protein